MANRTVAICNSCQLLFDTSNMKRNPQGKWVCISCFNREYDDN